MAAPALKQLFPRGFLSIVFVLVALAASAADTAAYANRVAPLIDPAKLATLGKRGANPRVQKYVAQLAEARQAGIAPATWPSAPWRWRA